MEWEGSAMEWEGEARVSRIPAAVAGPLVMHLQQLLLHP